MAPILALENISKRVGAVVVADGIGLALAEGEALGIIGPNGAAAWGARARSRCRSRVPE